MTCEVLSPFLLEIVVCDAQKHKYCICTSFLMHNVVRFWLRALRVLILASGKSMINCVMNVLRMKVQDEIHVLFAYHCSKIVCPLQQV